MRRVGRGAGTTVSDLDQLCGHCGEGKLAISPEGEVWPCVFSRWLRLGNVHASSLAEVNLRAKPVRRWLAAAFANHLRDPSLGRRCDPDRLCPPTKRCDPDDGNPAPCACRTYAAIPSNRSSHGEGRRSQPPVAPPLRQPAAEQVGVSLEVVTRCWGSILGVAIVVSAGRFTLASYTTPSVPISEAFPAGRSTTPRRSWPGPLVRPPGDTDRPTWPAAGGATAAQNARRARSPPPDAPRTNPARVTTISTDSRVHPDRRHGPSLGGERKPAGQPRRCNVPAPAPPREQAEVA